MQVDFLSRAQWKEELTILLEDLRDNDGNIRWVNVLCIPSCPLTAALVKGGGSTAVFTREADTRNPDLHDLTP